MTLAATVRTVAPCSRVWMGMSMPPTVIMFASPGNDRERLVCNDCGFVNYVNPKIIVGSVATEDKVLLCRRVEPRSSSGRAGRLRGSARRRLKGRWRPGRGQRRD